MDRVMVGVRVGESVAELLEVATNVGAAVGRVALGEAVEKSEVEGVREGMSEEERESWLVGVRV